MRNGDIAELLARSAEEFERGSNKYKALRRASRAALTWPVEVSNVVARGESLEQLTSVGPYVAKMLANLSDTPVGEFDALRAGFLTKTEVDELVQSNDLRNQVRGDFQVHTTDSDGTTSMDIMVDSAIELGYKQLLITDHTKGLPIANGMDEDGFLRQREIIDSRNAHFRRSGIDFTILAGAEMNLSPQGEGDMDPQFLASLDLVLGAFHSKLRLRDDQTDRYIAAVRNPTINVLAHPRCRVYNFRLGLSADWARVFEEAQEQDVAVEIDGYADRQDLNVDLLELARETGVRISLGSDAHAPGQMRYLDFAIAAAVKARIPADRIINTMPPTELIAWAKSRRPTN